MEKGNYDQAIDVLEALNGFKDSEDLIQECEKGILDSEYKNALQLMEEGHYEEAIDIFEDILSYEDSEAQIEYCKKAILDEKYDEAITLMEKNQYEEAIVIFEELNGYKDSVDQIQLCEQSIKERDYNEAVKLASEGKYEEALELLNTVGDYKESNTLIKKYELYGCKVGSEFRFGSYEQDNNLENGTEEIEWIVLKREENKVFVVSKYCLENKAFNETLATVTWGNSTLRKWLNENFLKETFGDKEKAQIIMTTLSNPDYADDGEKGNDTTDKVFLLSENEAIQYFESDSERMAYGTEYVSSEYCCWFLRTTGNASNAGYVDYDGNVGYYEDVDREWGIRPAMWIKINTEE